MTSPYSDLIQEAIWEAASPKDLFSSVMTNKKNFALITKVLLNKEGKEAYFYQTKLLKNLFKMKNTRLRDDLLEMKIGNNRVIDIIKFFSGKPEIEGEPTFYAWSLCEQYLGSLAESRPKFITEMNAAHAEPSLLQKINAYYSKYAPYHQLSKLSIGNKNKLSSSELREVFNLIKIGLSPNQKNVTLKTDSIEALNTFINISGDFDQIEQIIEPIATYLNDPFCNFQNTIQAVLQPLIKTLVATNKNDKALDFITQCLKGFPFNRRKAAQDSEILIKALIDFSETDKVFDFFIENVEFFNDALSIQLLEILINSKKTDEILKFTQKIFDKFSIKADSTILKDLGNVTKNFKRPSQIHSLIFILINLSSGLPDIRIAAFEILKAFIENPIGPNTIDKIFNFIIETSRGMLAFQTAALEHLKNLIESGIDFHKKAVEIINLIEEKLDGHMDDLKIGALQLLAVFIKTNTPFKYTDDTLRLIQKGLDSSDSDTKIAALQALTALIKTNATSNNTDKILKMIETVPSDSSNLVKITLTQTLTTLIEVNATPYNTGDILKLIQKDLVDANNKNIKIATLQALTALIRTNTASNNTDDILKTIKIALGDNSDEVKIATLQTLTAFISANTASNNTDDILKLIKIALGDNSDQVKISALQTLTALIGTHAASNNTDDILKLIQQGLVDPHNEVKIAALQTLTALIRANTASNNTEDILKLIQKDLVNPNNDIKIAALQAFSACAKNKTPVPLALWETVLECAHTTMENALNIKNIDLRKTHFSILTTLIRHCPPEVIESKQEDEVNIQKIKELLRFFPPLINVTIIPEKTLRQKVEALIKSYSSQNREEFSKDLTTLISRSKTVGQTSDLFNLFYSGMKEINANKNTLLHKALGINKLNPFSSAIKEIRKHAFSQLLEEVKSKGSHEEKINLLENAKEKPIFKSNRNKFVSKIIPRKTSTINQINSKISELKNKKEPGDLKNSDQEKPTQYQSYRKT